MLTHRRTAPGESSVAIILRLSLAALIFLVFFLLDDLANELLLSAGLGTDRILTCDRRIFYGGGQLGEDVAVRLVAVNQSELIEIMTTNNTSANAIPIRQRIATDHILNNNADNTVAASTR